MSILTIYPFDTPSNYVYDSTVIEVLGSSSQLLSQAHEDATIRVNYCDLIDV